MDLHFAGHLYSEQFLTSVTNYVIKYLSIRISAVLPHNYCESDSGIAQANPV
jgi:hypothetical protein